MTCFGVILLGAPVIVAQQSRVENAAPTVNVPSTVAEFPDSPGTTYAKSQQTIGSQNVLVATPLSASGETEAQAVEPAVSTPSAPTQESAPTSSTEKPVGTAVAEPIRANGIAGSQPAGVAIAPAKQRRVRTMVLRVGAILGAGVAIGSVLALTEATPSKPPGAH
jgi:hypothetical protein